MCTQINRASSGYAQAAWAGYGVSDVTLQVDLLVGIGLINLEVEE